VTELQKWEYRFQTLGSVMKKIRDEELQELLDEWGTEGWEIFAVSQDPSMSKIRLYAKRPLTDRARRQRSMPA
jgi:hypothetical protein